MRNIILDTDDLRHDPAETAAQIRIDGELYNVKRPKKATGISISRLAETAGDDPDAGEDIVRKFLKAFLIEDDDVEYLVGRVLDLEDDLDIDFLAAVVGRLQQHFENQDQEQTATVPSARARAVRQPADRPGPTSKRAAPKAKKRTAPARPVKQADTKAAKSA